jgi:hypothetical protein
MKYKKQSQHSLDAFLKILEVCLQRCQRRFQLRVRRLPSAPRPYSSTQRSSATYLVPRPYQLFTILRCSAPNTQIGRAQRGRRLQRALDLLLDGVVRVRRHVVAGSFVVLYSLSNISGNQGTIQRAQLGTSKSVKETKIRRSKNKLHSQAESLSLSPSLRFAFWRLSNQF